MPHVIDLKLARARGRQLLAANDPLPPKILRIRASQWRDFKSAAEVRQALLDGRDFFVADMSSRWDGKPVSLPDMRADGVTTVNVRYMGLARVVVFQLADLVPPTEECAA